MQHPPNGPDCSLYLSDLSWKKTYLKRIILSVSPKYFWQRLTKCIHEYVVVVVVVVVVIAAAAAAAVVVVVVVVVVAVH